MNFKKGVTFSVVIVAIVLMLIVISSASIIGSKAISTANFEEFKSEVQRVFDNVNEYYVKNDVLPLKSAILNLNNFDTDFKNLILSKEGANPVLYVVDMSAIKDTTIKKGNGDVNSKDVYLVSEFTQNVYYLAGYKYNGTTYYTF